MKTLILATLALSLAACSPFGFNPMGYEVKHEDLDAAWRKVAAMRYIHEDGDYWKSPEEFFADGGGDCEDFAAALIYLLGPDAKMAIIQDGSGSHAIVIYDGTYIEPQKYCKYYTPDSLAILGVYSFHLVMGWATDYGIRNL